MPWFTPQRESKVMKISKTSLKSGFTLVEIMIVVAIIGLLAAIAVPNFVKARTTAQQNACINNLRQMDGAIQQWALESRQGPDNNVQPSDITPYIKLDSHNNLPGCPGGGEYGMTTVANHPTCTLGGDGYNYPHKLP